MNKQTTFERIKTILGDIPYLLFDIDLIDESVVVDLERAPGWEFKVDAVSQKDGEIFLETWPAKERGCAQDVEGISENELYIFPLNEVAETHNGPGEILETLELLVPLLPENPNIAVKPRN